MKLSDKILEQYKIDQYAICEKVDITASIVESLAEDIAQYKQAYKDALFMEGEIERKEELERYKPKNLYRLYDNIKAVCSKCKKGTLEETISMEGVDGWGNHIAVACRVCQEEGVVRKNDNL
jgi:hypothetical protein